MQDLNSFFETRAYPVALGVMTREAVKRGDEPFITALLEELSYVLDTVESLEDCLNLEVA